MAPTSPTVRLGRVAATLAVRDIQAAYATYRAVFGFEKTFENGDPVGFMILEKDQAELHLTRQANHKAPPHNVAHMIVSDAAEVYARCQAHGLRIIKGIRNEEFGLRSFVFADADGNRIDVGEVLQIRSEG